jgi:hypothetical protein
MRASPGVIAQLPVMGVRLRPNCAEADGEITAGA